MTFKWKRANKPETTNERKKRFDWFIEQIQTARGFCLVKRTLGWKNFTPEKFIEINRYFALTSYCKSKTFRLLEAKCCFYWKEFDDFSAFMKCFVQTLFSTFVPDEQITEVRVKEHNECARTRWGISMGHSSMDTDNRINFNQHGRPSSLPAPEIM